MNIKAQLIIDHSRFDDIALIESRVAAVPTVDQGSLRSALRYLYLSDGPINLPRVRLLASEPYLDSAECLVIRWLYTRTNGSERKNYGQNALLAARTARYRCQSCDFADVRALNLDHVHGRESDMDEFSCLCANCHTIKSREHDWSIPPQEM